MRKITALIVLLGTSAGIAARAESPNLLVRLEERSLREGGIVRTEVLVYRDGAVTTRQEIGFLIPPMVRVLRQTAGETEMQTLGLALLNNRVGLQHGECFLDSGNVEEARLQTQVDWFGKGLRRNSFVTDTTFPVECGPEIYALADAISDVFSHASVIDDKILDDLIAKIE